MNSIDKNFTSLTKEIEQKSLEEVFTHIRNKFQKIPLEIQDSLENYFSKFPYWGKLKREDGIFEELYLRSVSIKEHLEDFTWLYSHLGDYRSKKTLYAILNNWYNFDFQTLATSIEANYSHYFDLDLIKCGKEDVIVDLGAYIGDTILDYLNQYGSEQYKKIYCYEITEESFNILKQNLSYYPNIEFRRKAISDHDGILSFQKSSVDHSANMIDLEGDNQVEAVSLDQDLLEPVTLIKMDIEGSEEKALLGARAHITKEHPQLLISIYHNHEDIWKIPRLVKEMWDGYQLHLRYYGNHIFPTEIVLFATKS